MQAACTSNGVLPVAAADGILTAAGSSTPRQVAAAASALVCSLQSVRWQSVHWQAVDRVAQAGNPIKLSISSGGAKAASAPGCCMHAACSMHAPPAQLYRGLLRARGTCYIGAKELSEYTVLSQHQGIAVQMHCKPSERPV